MKHVIEKEMQETTQEVLGSTLQQILTLPEDSLENSPRSDAEDMRADSNHSSLNRTDGRTRARDLGSDIKHDDPASATQVSIHYIQLKCSR